VAVRVDGDGAARRLALSALAAVERGATLPQAMARVDEAAVPREDRRLAVQLAYGVLRHRRLLDWWIDQTARGRVDPVVRNILRLAYFQAAFLSRVPRYAIVHTAVEQTKRVRPGAMGFVNAVLRQGLDRRPEPEDLGVRYSHPDWLVSRWLARWGRAETERILAASNEVAPLTLRVAPPLSAPVIAEQLGAAGVAATVSRWVVGAVRVTGSLWLEDWWWFRAGLVAVQDEASQLVTWVLAPKPGEHILDLAAGLGGKTRHILDWAPGVRVTAVDTRADRLAAFDHPAVTPWVADARALPEDWGGRFDRVLLDAPCSNLGVLRRRVDARWHKRPDQLPEWADRQRAMLQEAARVLKVGGVLVYSVCSTEPEETDEVVAAAERFGLERESPAAWLPPRVPAARLDRSGWLVRPGQEGLDGLDRGDRRRAVVVAGRDGALPDRRGMAGLSRPAAVPRAVAPAPQRL
jgi:16S rRNA (cytosine967-C5)-methyltransferase